MIKPQFKQITRTSNHIFPSRQNASERGQGLVEYSLILVLISLVGTVSLVAVGPAVKEAFCIPIETLDPGAVICTGTAPDAGAGPNVLKVKYQKKKGNLFVKVKAPKGCEDIMRVIGYGEMERQGSSRVFKINISVSEDEIPETLTIGSYNAGYTTYEIDT